VNLFWHVVKVVHEFDNRSQFVSRKDTGGSLNELGRS
jgi:hypothetical protein